MDERSVMALRTPLYLILAGFGALIFVATFLPWARVSQDGGIVVDPGGGGISVAGIDAGGWGAAALVAGLAILVVSLIGYFWNPFSDPEALFIAGFAIATLLGVLVKIGDAASFVDPSDDFRSDASAGIGLWLILISALVSLGGAAWIVVSRPRAEGRLAD